jgi:hypothetical protein
MERRECGGTQEEGKVLSKSGKSARRKAGAELEKLK